MSRFIVMIFLCGLVLSAGYWAQRLSPEQAEHLRLLGRFYSSALYYETIGSEAVPAGASAYDQAMSQLRHSDAYALPLDVAAVRNAVDRLASYTPLAARTVATPATLTGGVRGLWLDGVPARGELAHVLYLHGGAFVAGGARSHGGFLSRLVHAVPARGLLVDYRLHPDAGLADMLDDAVAAYTHLLDVAAVPASRIVVAGDEAGGSLAVMLVRELLRRQLPAPAGVVLISPWLDMQGVLPSHRKNCDDSFNRSFIQHVGAVLTGRDRQLTAHWSHVLLNDTDFAGFPHVIVFVSTAEPLYHDGSLFALAALKANRPVTLVQQDHQPHAYPLLPDFLPAAARALQQIVRFVAEKTAPAVKIN